jgi:hypothetical protein
MTKVIELKLNSFLDDSNLRKSLIDNGEKFILNYFSYQRKLSKYLSGVLFE